MPEVLNITPGRITTITLTRPDVRNAFDDHLIAELTAACERLAADPQVRVVILAGSGKAFSAGADVNWMKRMAGFSRAENLADAGALARMLRTLRDLPRPTIARVHGAAFGGALGLIAACDLAVAIDEVTLCFSEVKLGLIPATIAPFVIERIGPGAARRLMLTAECFTGRHAERIGLVTEVVADEATLDERVSAWAEQLCTNSPAAMARIKPLVRAAAGADAADVDQAMARLIADARASDEGQEGLAAFLEKRKAKWVDG